ncbi:MAG: hypothetical protein JNK52_12130 [Zoogloeaceae bacterium]|nr:hypothetical protein [Zoogloeaceae bacterium]
MIDVAPHLDAIYATLGEPVTPAAGAVFNGVFSVADIDAFGAAQVGDYTLRYPAGAIALQRDDVLTIRGQLYQVASHPRRVGDGREWVAELMEVTA